MCLSKLLSVSSTALAVQEEVGKLAMTAIEYPPMQKGASFNLDAVKAKIAEAMARQAK